jgi:hypothetical protein
MTAMQAGTVFERMVIGSSIGFWCLILQPVRHQTHDTMAYSASAAVK